MRIIIAIYAFSLIHHSICAQKKLQVEVKLKDNGSFIGETEWNDISLTTKYGTLKIPVADISRIYFGVRKNDELKSRVIKLIADLNSDSKSVADKAEEDLIKVGVDGLGYINAQLDVQVESSDFSGLADRLREIITEVESSSGDYEFRENDAVVFNDESKMEGTLSQNDISLKTQFGALKIDRKFINFVTVLSEGGGDGLARNFALLANKHIATNPQISDAFLNTKIKVKKGDRLEIKASGSVVLASLSYKSFSPAGSNAEGSWSNIPYGALAAKIGETGVPFYIGNKYNNIAQESGLLYLTIAESLHNTSNTGQYKVTVKIVRK